MLSQEKYKNVIYAKFLTNNFVYMLDNLINI